MALITVETNIPLPPDRRTKYPWRKLSVGDSFFVPRPPDRGIAKHMKTMSTIAISTGKRLNMIFVARIIDDGVRIWRVE